VADQLSLLGEDGTPPDLPPGLLYEPEFVDGGEAEDLLGEIDREDAPWLSDLSRRVQHYGFKYDYQARRIVRSMHLGPLPGWLRGLADKVTGFVESNEDFESVEPLQPFDQAIINEYEPGQGISAHVDCEPCFGPVVATLSLGSAVEMQFEHIRTGVRKPVHLGQRSLAVLTGETRSEWNHSISNRQSDPPLNGRGQRVQRGRRVSITFRTVILD
jgi:alkylated DNA repair dioxygenase AlkB